MNTVTSITTPLEPAGSKGKTLEPSVLLKNKIEEDKKADTKLTVTSKTDTGVSIQPSPPPPQVVSPDVKNIAIVKGKHKTSKSGSFLEGEPAFKSLQEELMYKKNNLKKCQPLEQMKIKKLIRQKHQS